MIICHEHKYIFLKTAKTAGTSIEIALSKFCGGDDVITKIWAEDEQVRSSLGYRGPQNFLAPLWDYSLADWAKRLRHGDRKVRFYNHMSAREIKRFVPRKTWNSYFKFCFERNPWDRVISLYFWRYRSGPRPSLSEFVSSDFLKILKTCGHDVYRIDGEVAVDRVCRFESLSDELESVRTLVGIPESLDLPHSKAQFRKDKRSYREILSDRDRAIIAEAFQDEIALLGYEY